MVLPTIDQAAKLLRDLSDEMGKVTVASVRQAVAAQQGLSDPCQSRVKAGFRETRS